MKIEILKENLKSGLSVVERIIGKNASLPILDNVLMGVEDSFLSLVSTNLETTIKLWILTKIIKKGSVVVPAKFLSSLISTLPNEKVLMEAKDQNLLIECDTIKTQVQGFNTEEFPIIPEFKNEDVVQVDNKSFCWGLSQIINIPTPSQSRPEISGIYLAFSKNTVKLAATDSFRLAEKNITLASPVTKDFALILPQRPAAELVHILGEREGALTMYISRNQVMFELGMKEVKHPQVQITSRLLEGEYPNYQEIIPTKFKTSATVKRDEFFNLVKTASLFSNKTNEVKIKVIPEKQSVEIFAKSAEVGESRAGLAAKTTGEHIEVSFNHKYILEGLANIKSSEVIFDISKEEGPCMLRPVGDASYIYVVMPIKSI